VKRLLPLLAVALLAGCGSSGTLAPTHTVTRAAQLHQPGAPVLRPALRVVPIPTSAGAEGKADGRVMAGSASCGRERWAVKTATDPAAGNIKLVPISSMIEAIDALPATNNGNPDQERAPAEEQTYTVTATLDAAKVEADSDIHLALSDNGHTMIAEIPNAPACTEPPVTPEVSVLETQIEQARNSFIQEFGLPSSTGFTAIGHKVTVTGVLFGDKIHGQRGVAPRGVELHPVTAISDP
jgi:hypothetical protein